MTLDARRIRGEVLDDERRHPALVDVGVRDCPAVATPPEPAIAPELLRRLVFGEAVRDAILGIGRHAAHGAERSRGAEWRGVQVAIADPRELQAVRGEAHVLQAAQALDHRRRRPVDRDVGASVERREHGEAVGAARRRGSRSRRAPVPGCVRDAGRPRRAGRLIGRGDGASSSVRRPLSAPSARARAGWMIGGRRGTGRSGRQARRRASSARPSPARAAGRGRRASVGLPRDRWYGIASGRLRLHGRRPSATLRGNASLRTSPAGAPESWRRWRWRLS